MTQSTGKRVLPFPAFPLTTSKILLEAEDSSARTSTASPSHAASLSRQRRTVRHHDPEAVFRFLVKYKLDHDGCAPATEEIMEACAISSRSVTRYVLRILEKNHKVILKKKRGIRMIMVVGGTWSYSKPDGSSK